MAFTRLSLAKTWHIASPQRVFHLAWSQCLSKQYTVSTGVPPTMSAWQISKYGSLEDLHFSPSILSPVIRRPDEVIVQVHAASVNPIDTMMLGGYGSATINPLRKVLSTTSGDGSEFPLTLGRDFSGTIIKTGAAVPSQKFKPGDEVWGAVSASSHGTHAEYVVASALEISKKPVSLSHQEAASIPYVAATTWAAVSTIGWMSEGSTRRKKVLVFGGSGGLGTFAVQLFKAWGAEVSVTCASDAVGTLEYLGADHVIDYQEQNIRQALQDLKGKGYDFILDAVGNEETSFVMNLLKPYVNATYVTVVLPLLRNNDEMGLPLGLAKSALSLGLDAVTHLREGKHYRWSVFLPNGRGLAKVASLVDEDKIQPVIERVFAFQDTPLAYEKVMAKHNRGKTVIDVHMESTEEPTSERNKEDTNSDMCHTTRDNPPNPDTVQG